MLAQSAAWVLLATGSVTIPAERRYSPFPIEGQFSWIGFGNFLDGGKQWKPPAFSRTLIKVMSQSPFMDQTSTNSGKTGSVLLQKSEQTKPFSASRGPANPRHRSALPRRLYGAEVRQASPRFPARSGREERRRIRWPACQDQRRPLDRGPSGKESLHGGPWD